VLLLLLVLRPWVGLPLLLAAAVVVVVELAAAGVGIEEVGAKPSSLPSAAAAPTAGEPVRKWWGALAWKVCTRWRNRASSSLAGSNWPATAHCCCCCCCCAVVEVVVEVVVVRLRKGRAGRLK
jgi:hypothetical protein